MEEKRSEIKKTFGIIRANTNDGRASEFLDPCFQLSNKTGAQKTILAGNLNKKDKVRDKNHVMNTENDEGDNFKKPVAKNKKAKRAELLNYAKYQPREIKEKGE